MCTLTCCAVDGGFVVHMNRDESQTRARGTAPQIVDLGGIRALCPIDVEHGGTWIGVNEHGVAVGLLNGDPAGVTGAGPWRSRGNVALAALATRSAADASAVALAIDASAHRPFVLFAIDRAATALVVESGPMGVQRRALKLPTLLASSSVAHNAAMAARSAQFAQWLEGADDVDGRLAAFHRTHAPVRGPLSVCMHRDDACTVSATRVRVTAHGIAMAHHDGAPCADLAWAHHELALVEVG
jgi:hypothetical protein